MPKRKNVKPFAYELKLLNTQVQKSKLEGIKNYFTLNDLRNVYEDWQGRCCYCGLALVYTRYLLNTAHFAFYIPLSAGGSVSPKNLVLICSRCQTEKTPKRPPSTPVFSYNAFSDLLVQLSTAVYMHDEEKIKHFKVLIDHALNDYIGTLYYKPLGLPELPEIRIEGFNAFSDKIESLCKELENVLRESETSRNYRVARRGMDSV